MTRLRYASTALAGGVFFALVAISGCQSEEPQVGSQTNWLKACDTSGECGELECICGTCTTTCTADEACDALGASSCVATDDDGSIALCGGVAPSNSMCLQRCEEGTCPSGSHCVAGVCSPNQTPSMSVSIDPSSVGQELVGIGASISYDGDWIVGHPEKTAIYDALFAQAGLDMIRVRSRWNGDNPEALAAAAEIVSEAEARRSTPPIVLLTSSSPPAELKANGVRFCGQSEPDCTLARDVDGNFDYAGFGAYWSSLLQAYEDAGVLPDYISIQNNPDWLPRFPEGGEACRFLPEEGTLTVNLTDGTTTEAEFPGYDRALDAVRAALEPGGDRYVFLAPETESINTVASYTDALDSASYGTVGYHMFAINPADPPLEQLEALKSFVDETGLSHMQTEMGADAMGTAILLHHTFVTGGGAAYLQQQLVSQAKDRSSGAPIGTDAETYEIQPALHALAHFARHTEPGWSLVTAEGDSEEVLASAWLSPDGDDLTVVLVNPGDSEQDVELTLPSDWQEALLDATVTRSVFEGLELSAELGTFSTNGVTRVPGGSIVTVAVSR